ncbi:unnamed protein product [Caenorhabditis angaria]|uniref:Protein KRI1 homolog n=1 Tax=Caenorhabditis angaria TaxID=860376 RepID=A0A9P1I6W2_9PELO|nr:unnamed protein product [Caenorhabditis angaria]
MNEKDDEDFYDWMKTENSKSDKKKCKELKHLKKFWKDDANLDESEKFLRDYLINKDYVPGETEENPTYDEIVALEEDEKDMDKNREYERKFNFRFEDPDQEFIKSYPRTVQESMRTENSQRKEKRNEKEERKKKEKEEKKKELRELQKMKKSEIEQKLEKLKKAAGCDIPISLDELNADFDPKEFDRKMKEIFNEEYYGEIEEVKEDEMMEKPIFSDFEEDSDYEDYDKMDVDEIKKQSQEEKEEEDSEDGETSEKPQKSGIDVKKNGKFDMVAAAQKAMKKDSDENRRKKKKNVLKEALAKKKPRFDPKEKTFEQYFNEYYALDYEDIIGDQITRFKYREVEPNDFGLTTDEILDADERQLNAWASLKKVTAYRSSQEEHFDKNAYKRKAADKAKKSRIFATDFGGKKSLKRKLEEEKERLENEGEEIQEDNVNLGAEKKKKKRGKKKAKVVEKVQEVAPEIPEPEQAPVEAQSEENSAEPKKMKRKRNKNGGNAKTNVLAEKFGSGVTDSRVKAYGLNPSRLKKGLIYGSGPGGPKKA